mgnify:CR=1 FL=1
MSQHAVVMELAEIEEMSRISREMLSDSLDAFVRGREWVLARIQETERT